MAGSVAGPAMLMARAGAAAVQIDEGRVGVFGAIDVDDGDDSVNSSEILKLQTGAFSAGPTLGSERAFLTAAAV